MYNCVYILITWLSKWFDIYNIIDNESQTGYRRNYFTIDTSFIFISLTRKYLSKKEGSLYCISFDFENAFESRWHDIMWDALKRMDVRGKCSHTCQPIYGLLCNVGIKALLDFDKRCTGSPNICSAFINGLANYLNINCNSDIFLSKDLKD